MSDETITIRLPEGMREKLRLLSQANNRSMNGQVVEVLQKAIDNHPIPIPIPIPKPN